MNIPLLVKWHIRQLSTVYLFWAGVCFLIPSIQFFRDYWRICNGARTAINASHKVDGIPIPDILFQSLQWILNPTALFTIFVFYIGIILIKMYKD